MKELPVLVNELTTLLKSRAFKIATAESCTGGLIAGLLTDLPGSSQWFERGFVTYSNLAKQELLAVDPSLIERHGAVSREVVEAMALGALQHSAADLALAVTGIAGPDGGSLEKPVGTVWFAWVAKAIPLRSERCDFQNASRSEVRRLACEQALQGALQHCARRIPDIKGD